MMKKTRYSAAAVAALAPLAAACSAGSGLQPEAARPNILIVLADDMGYSDIACYGGEVSTPNIDSLAVRGVKWAQFYNNARSCPSRAALMTGLYPHETGVGWMSVASLQYPQYQGYLNDSCVTVADVLSASGYDTYLAGKWHLSSDRQNTGHIPDNWPLHRGFNHFWGIANGFSDYYDVLLNDGDSTFRSAALIPEGGDRTDFYLTDAIADHACSYIDGHDFGGGPMFMYLAFTAPHYPLQAPAEVYRKYYDIYINGWDSIREQRFARQKELGLFAPGVQLSPRSEGLPAWDSIPDAEKRDYAMRMAIYAAQIEIMDAGIGRVVEALRRNGQLDNTAIFFMSDNGASAEIKSTGKSKAIDGGPDTFESYRPVWANASDTPYKLFKHYTYEGGITSPLIVSWPAAIKPREGYIRDWGHFVDIMPTCVELAGASYPSEFKGHAIKPMRGTSLVPWFRPGGSARRGMYFWEHEGNIAVRDGKWKLVNHIEMGNRFDPSALSLYNMAEDPTEMNDLSGRHPARVRRMWEAWKEWAADAEVLPMVLTLHADRKMMDSQRINGTFDDGLGYWTTSCTAPADVRYGVCDGWSGNAARVEILKRGGALDDAVLSWLFSVSNKASVSVGMSYVTSKANVLTMRITDKAHPELSPMERTVDLQPSDTPVKVLFEDIALKGARHPKSHKYSLDLCFGASECGTVLLDDIVLDGDFEDFSIICDLSSGSARHLPLVGISCSRSRSGSALLPTTYSDAVRRAGGVPVVIPTVSTPEEARALVAALDGVVFSGGEDVNPAWYGEEVLNQTVEIDHVRDRSDSLLARAALASGKPVLAICRGSQLLNVLLGGSLYQDLPSQRGVSHSDVMHAIGVREGSFLARIYGTDSLIVNSMHHQAVKDEAPGITVVARSADGIVEAWEAPHVWAVQFHPEKMLASGDSFWLPLFQSFVNQSGLR